MPTVTIRQLEGRTVEQKRELAKEVHIDFKKVVVIGNRFPPGMEEEFETRLEEQGLFFGGMIPNDDEVAKLNYLGTPLTELPDDSPAVQAIEKIAEKLGLLSDVTLMKLLGAGM